MHVFLFIAIILFLSELSNAEGGNELDDIFIEQNEYEDYDYGPLEKMKLDDDSTDSDSDIHVIANKDDLRQIIFNPKKRRERRKKHRGICDDLMSANADLS